MTPIRVARILGRANVGGPARTALTLTRRLVEHGVETLLVVGEPGEAEGDLTEGIEGLDIERVPGLRRRLSPGDLWSGAELRRVLERFEPDVVHTHASKAGALGRRAALALPRRPKVVHTFHGHVLNSYFSAPASWLFETIERRLARRTDVLIAVSARVRDELVERHRVAPREKFRVIDNGIDLAPYRPANAASRRAARLRLGVDEECTVVLVPARLVPIKGHDLLLRALRHLPASLGRVEVLLLGDGPSRTGIERRARALDGPVRVRCLGFRDDLPQVLPGADAVVLPSRSEGMPIALIEAMACGVPVVATAVGGVEDLVESGVTGLVCEPGDAAALAFAMARVLSDVELARSLGDRAREQALAHHDVGRVIRAHAALYRELTGRAVGGDGSG